MGLEISYEGSFRVKKSLEWLSSNSKRQKSSKNKG